LARDKKVVGVFVRFRAASTMSALRKQVDRGQFMF
jgi:hypothetical protein